MRSGFVSLLLVVSVSCHKWYKGPYHFIFNLHYPRPKISGIRTSEISSAGVLIDPNGGDLSIGGAEMIIDPGNLPLAAEPAGGSSDPVGPVISPVGSASTTGLSEIALGPMVAEPATLESEITGSMIDEPATSRSLISGSMISSGPASSGSLIPGPIVVEPAKSGSEIAGPMVAEPTTLGSAMTGGEIISIGGNDILDVGGSEIITIGGKIFKKIGSKGISIDGGSVLSSEVGGMIDPIEDMAGSEISSISSAGNIITSDGGTMIDPIGSSSSIASSIYSVGYPKGQYIRYSSFKPGKKGTKWFKGARKFLHFYNNQHKAAFVPSKIFKHLIKKF